MPHKAEYVRKLNKSTFILTAEKEFEREKDSIEMFHYNSIPYFLIMETHQENMKLKCCYDITGRHSLDQLFEYKPLDYQLLKKILYSFDQACIQSENYMLSENDILLKPEFIFSENDCEHIVFCYLPGNQLEICKQFQELMEYLLQKADHNDEHAVQLAYGIYQRVAIGQEALHDTLKDFEKGMDSDPLKLPNIPDIHQNLKQSKRSSTSTQKISTLLKNDSATYIKDFDNKSYLQHTEQPENQPVIQNILSSCDNNSALHLNNSAMHLNDSTHFNHSAFPQNYQSTQTDSFPQNYQSTQTDSFPQNYQSTQTDSFPQSYQSTQTDSFPQSYQSTQTDSFPQSYQSTQTDSFPQSYQPTQTECSQYSNQSLQYDKQIAHTESFPQIDQLTHAKQFPYNNSTQPLNIQQDNHSDEKIKEISRKSTKKIKLSKEADFPDNEQMKNNSKSQKKDCFKKHAMDKIKKFLHNKMYTNKSNRIEDEPIFEAESEEEMLVNTPTVCLVHNTNEIQNKFIYQGADRSRDFDCVEKKMILGSNIKDCDIYIPLPMISRVHALIAINDQGTFLEDLNSTNGTQVNGKLLQYRERHMLQKGDIVSLAGECYSFH